MPNDIGDFRKLCTPWPQKQGGDLMSPQSSVEDCVVLVINHQPIFLNAMARLIETIGPVKVVTHRLIETLDEVKDDDVDVVTVDPSFGGQFRLEMLVSVKKRWPSARIVVVTDCTEPSAITAALACGVHSFLLKAEPVETVRAGIELVCRGAAALSSPAAMLVSSRPIAPRAVASAPRGPVRGVTPREVEVLQFVAQGYTDLETGRILGLSNRTIGRHVTNILNKLNCRSRSQAVAQVLGAEPMLARGQRLPLVAMLAEETSQTSSVTNTSTP